MLREHWPQVLSHNNINSWQIRVLGALKKCRTADLGGHIDACTDCGVVRISYNSCRNRHCPKCQGIKREEWIAARENELLPVPYFHVVFTLPDLLNPLAIHQPKELYDTLFEAAWQTLKKFGMDGGTNRDDRYPAYLGANAFPAPPSALHRSRGWVNRTGEMENG